MKKIEFMEQAGELFEELRQWRAEHGEASFDEIAEEVTGRRQKLMGVLLKELAEQCGQGELLTEGQCASCGGELHYKGKKKREVLHPEGTAALERGYHHCEPCGHGVFPPGREIRAGGTELESRDGEQTIAGGGGSAVV